MDLISAATCDSHEGSSLTTKRKSFWDGSLGQVVLAVVVVVWAALMIALAYTVFLVVAFLLSRLGVDPGIRVVVSLSG